MLMLTLRASWVNQVAVASTTGLPVSPTAAVTLVLIVVALMLVWTMRQLQPAVAVVAQLFRAFILTAMVAAVIIGALVLMLATAVVH
ncbi:hypothetical protein GCM10009765_46040 [Fodinicola feengrottensis]|uniref:Uncharacterized protein n=1 Tax=Fodinicola feengrottensis TaxID=435914 RepID=A0ABN2HQI6_9ACTN